MKGSVLILTLFIMAAVSMLIITAFSIAEAHFTITRNNNLYQEVYYLAESCMSFAHSELFDLITQVHEDCLNEFNWDPLQESMHTMQESVRKYIENALGPKINKALNEKGYNTNFPVPVMPELTPEAKLDIRIRFTNVYQNPSRLQISSRAELGKIRRRIDSEVYINKVSKVYDNFLFDKVLLTGGDILVANGGSLEIYGSIHSQGGLQVINNSSLYFDKSAALRQEIRINNNSHAIFNNDVVCYGLSAEGENSSFVKCTKDLYLYSTLSVKDPDNTIQIKGKLYIAPEENILSAGVAASGGIIELEDEIFINGTLLYNSNEYYLFGIDYLPLQNGKYHSVESIGGGNYSFYFPESIPGYALKHFTPEFFSLDEKEKIDRIYKYLTIAPEEDDEYEIYLQHTQTMNLENVRIKSISNLSGYTSGFICANNQVIAPLNMPDHEIFFNNILKKMKSNTHWDYTYQITPYVSVSLINAIIERNALTVLNPDQPVICIISDTKDLTLPSGKYKGIIVTNGSVYIPTGADVEFSGLLICDGNLFIEGSLTLQENKGMILSLIGSENFESLRKFFRIEKEKELYEIISSKEVLYNQQW